MARCPAKIINKIRQMLHLIVSLQRKNSDTQTRTRSTENFMGHGHGMNNMTQAKGGDDPLELLIKTF